MVSTISGCLRRLEKLEKLPFLEIRLEKLENNMVFQRGRLERLEKYFEPYFVCVIRNKLSDF